MEERRGPRELMSQTRGWHNLGLWRQRGPQVSYLGGLWGSQSVRSGWKQGQDSCSQCVNVRGRCFSWELQPTTQALLLGP